MKKKFLFLIILIFISCESNTYEEISKSNIDFVKDTNPTYDKNVSQIISSNCVSCHQPGTVNQFPYLRNYNEVKEAVANGDVLCRIEGSCGNIMPQSGKMPQQNIDIIKLWKDQGYMN